MTAAARCDDSSRSPLLLVPRAVRNMNAIGEAAGFKVTIGSGAPWPDRPGLHLVSIWRGPMRAFRALTFLPAFLMRRRHTGGWITWPGWQFSIFDALMRVHRGGVELQVDGGVIPNDISVLPGGVEIAQYDEGGFTAYCGARDALIAAGVCKDRDFPTAKHHRRHSRWSLESPDSATVRYPDGVYVHWRETEAHAEAFRRKAALWQRGESVSTQPDTEHYVDAEAVRAAEQDTAFQKFMTVASLRA